MYGEWWSVSWWWDQFLLTLYCAAALRMSSMASSYLLDEENTAMMDDLPSFLSACFIISSARASVLYGGLKPSFLPSSPSSLPARGDEEALGDLAFDDDIAERRWEGHERLEEEGGLRQAAWSAAKRQW